MDTKLTLSLAILGETLQIERPWISSGLDGRLPFYNEPEIYEKNWGYSAYCRNMMQANNWCPFEIRRMEATLPGVTNVYFACSMKLPEPTAEHSNCTTKGCIAHKPLQTALHLSGCDGGCKTYQSDEGELVKWINEDKTPLIVWTDADRVKVSAHDMNTKKVVPFVALTHSWQDGIFDGGKDARGGNNRCIHMCQIEKLQETCDSLLRDKKPEGSQKVYFWIDVLCIPREAAVRSIAINQMQKIYSRARTVLVWDRNLIKTGKTGSPIEMNMRIRMSNWTQRMWTLQEAVLASDLHVQFRDGSVSIKGLKEARDEAKNDIEHQYHHVWKAGHPFSSAVFKLRQSNEDYRVQRLWEAVQFHLVTEPEQETIVLANILKLKVDKLEKVGHRHDDTSVIKIERMAKFLDMLDEQPGLGIPSGIIFVSASKLQKNGYAWAPETWLTKQAHSYPLMRPLHQVGSMMKDGFLVEFPGLIIHCPKVSLETETF